MIPCRNSPSLAEARGFTLIECLAVIAIIGVLSALLIPVVQNVRKSARAATTAGNLRQLGAAQLAHASEHRGEFTAIYNYNDGTSQKTWMLRLAPYFYPAITSSSQFGALRRNSATVFDVPEGEKGTATAPLMSVGMNWSIATSYGPQRYPLHAIPRPAAIILLGEMVEANSDTMTPHDDGGRGVGASATPGYRRAGDKALMTFCDGHVEGRGIAELAASGKTTATNPWRWW